MDDWSIERFLFVGSKFVFLCDYGRLVCTFWKREITNKEEYKDEVELFSLGWSGCPRYSIHTYICNLRKSSKLPPICPKRLPHLLHNVNILLPLGYKFLRLDLFCLGVFCTVWWYWWWLTGMIYHRQVLGLTMSLYLSHQLNAISSALIWTSEGPRQIPLPNLELFWFLMWQRLWVRLGSDSHHESRLFLGFIWPCEVFQHSVAPLLTFDCHSATIHYPRFPSNFIPLFYNDWLLHSILVQGGFDRLLVWNSCVGFRIGGSAWWSYQPK